MKSMKKIICLAVMLVLAAVIAFAVYNQQSVFEGDRIKNPDSYTTSFTVMNQTDEHTMRLSEGDTLEVEFAIRKGRADMTIGIDGEKPIYRGDNMQSGKFKIGITETSDYHIILKAEHASGDVSIQKQD